MITREKGKKCAVKRDTRLGMRLRIQSTLNELEGSSGLHKAFTQATSEVLYTQKKATITVVLRNVQFILT